MIPLFDASGNQVYLYTVYGFDSCSWYVSTQKLTQAGLIEAVMAEVQKLVPVADALNQESLELFGELWHDPSKSFSYIDYDNLKKGTIEEYDAFQSRWNSLIPISIVDTVMQRMGFEPLESRAGFSHPWCDNTPHECLESLKVSLEEAIQRAADS